ncbi:MAG: glycoside hydrolase family 5 protein [Myxococcota bacterium]|nr:glycoside hydrolase family 5 protein [Myxococcota bacterium]
MRFRYTFSFGALVRAPTALSFLAWGCLGSSATVPVVEAGALGPLDCTVEGGSPRAAPNGYYTKGAAVCTAAHRAHLFHGVDRPSFEWSAAGDHISAADFQRIAAWHANVVRIALNQDFWLAGAQQHNAGYQQAVDQAVQWAEAAGLDVILDLHWSDKGNLSALKSGQQKMADTNSVAFWTEVATRYKGDGRVLFELYNEPHDISPDVWLNGGSAGDYPAVGMQDLYNAVRAAGAENLVIAGGLNWAYALTPLPGTAINGYNVMYAVHPYNKSDNQPGGWDSNWGFVASTNFAPVIATEFGDSTAACSGVWDSTLVQYCDERQISWTAWAWYPGGCGFPSLVSDWAGTPTAQGQVIKDALNGYSRDPAGAVDAAAEASGVLPVDGAATPDGAADDSSADSNADSTVEGGDPDVASVSAPLAEASAADGSTDGGALGSDAQSE